MAIKSMLVAVAVVALVGCGAPSAPTPAPTLAAAAAKPPPSSGGASAGGATFAEDIGFAGALTGKITSARPGPAALCRASAIPNKTGGTHNGYVGSMVGQLNGREYAIEIFLDPYNGPGSYPYQQQPGGGINPSVFVRAADGSEIYSTQGGTLTVNPDETSGTFALDMAKIGSSARLQLSGSWRCK